MGLMAESRVPIGPGGGACPELASGVMGILTKAPVGIDPDVAFAAFLRHADERPGARFLAYHRDGEWRFLTRGEAAERVKSIAAGLVAAGLGAGERVALISENRYEWLLTDLAVMSAGGVTVPVYPSLPAPTVAGIVNGAGARLAVASSPVLGAKLAGTGARVLQIEGEITDWMREGCSLVLARELAERAAAVSPDDVATIVYTSGTTGESKGAVLLHRGLVAMARGGAGAYGVGPDDVLLSTLPWAHVFERLNGLHTAMYAGAEIWLSRGMDHLLEDVEEVRPTIAMAVPRLFEKVRDRVWDQVRSTSPLKQRVFRTCLAAATWSAVSPSPSALQRGLRAAADRVALGKVRQRLAGPRLRFFISGGAPLQIDVEEFFWALGIPLLQGWGMTELTSGATGNTLDHHRFGSVGLPLPGVEIEIAEDGEILTASPGRMVEYYGRPSATADTIDGRWLKTGDIGRVDEGGFLHITDRKKELIKTAGGKIVAPLPIESRLMEDELIEWAVLVGDGRPYITALIVPDWGAVRRAIGAGAEFDNVEPAGNPRARQAVQEVVDRVNSELAPFESVKAFALLPTSLSEERDELTPTLKVKRRVVDRTYSALIQAMYEKATAAHAGQAD